MFFYTEERDQQVISALCDLALKGGGLEGLQIVNYVNNNLHVQEGSPAAQQQRTELQEEAPGETEEIIKPLPEKKQESKKKTKRVSPIKKRGRPKKIK